MQKNFSPHYAKEFQSSLCRRISVLIMQKNFSPHYAEEFQSSLCRKISVLKELKSWTPCGEFVLRTEVFLMFLRTGCSSPYWQLPSYLSLFFSKIFSTKVSCSLSNRRSLDSSVSLVTTLRAAWPRDSGSIPGQRQQIFFFFRWSKPAQEPSLLFIEYREILPHV